MRATSENARQRKFNFRELRHGEVRRIPLPRTPVNKFYGISYAELSPCGELTRGPDRAY